MAKSSIDRRENMLCLNWNTIIFQSYGFIEYMKSLGLDDENICHLTKIECIVFLLQYQDRNLSYIFDDTVSEKEFYDFVKDKYTNITNISPVTHINAIFSVVKGQPFSNSYHIASIKKSSISDTGSNVKHVYFDIFNISEIEEYINENKITSVLAHDIRIVRDLIFNFNINCKDMSFIVSKLGYNFDNIDGQIVSKCQEIFENQESLGFRFAFLDVFELTEDDIKGSKDDNEFKW